MGWDRHKLLWDGTDKCVPWATLEIAVDRGVFRVLLGLLPPRLSPKEKRARK